MSETIDKLLPAHLQRASFHDRIFFIMQAVHALVPERFSLLEGFTREEGGVVFISREPRKIYNSGADLRALPLGSTGWYVNPAIAPKEARRFFDRLSRVVDLPLPAKQRIMALIK